MRQILSMTAFVLSVLLIGSVISSAESSSSNPTTKTIDDLVIDKQNRYAGVIDTESSPIVTLDHEGILWIVGENAKFYAGLTDIKMYSPKAASEIPIRLSINKRIIQFGWNGEQGIALDEGGDLWRFGNKSFLFQSHLCDYVVDNKNSSPLRSLDIKHFPPNKLKDCPLGGIELDLKSKRQMRYLRPNQLPQFKKIFMMLGRTFIKDENNRLWVVSHNQDTFGSSGRGEFLNCTVAKNADVFDEFAWQKIYPNRKEAEAELKNDEIVGCIYDSSGGDRSEILTQIPKFADIDKFIPNTSTIAIDSEGRVWAWGAQGLMLFLSRGNLHRNSNFKDKDVPVPNQYYPEVPTDHLCFNSQLSGVPPHKNNITDDWGTYVMCRPMMVKGLKDIVMVTDTRVDRDKTYTKDKPYTHYALDKHDQWWAWEPSKHPYRYTISCRDDVICSRTECHLLSVEKAVEQSSAIPRLEQACVDVDKQDVNSKK